MTRAFIFLIIIHRHFSLGNHRLNTSALQLQQRFLRCRESDGEITPKDIRCVYRNLHLEQLGTSSQVGLVSAFVSSPSFTISQLMKKPCKPIALVSWSLETRIYVLNYLPLVLHRLYDPSVLGASHSTDILRNKPLWYLPLG